MFAPRLICLLLYLNSQFIIEHKTIFELFPLSRQFSRMDRNVLFKNSRTIKQITSLFSLPLRRHRKVEFKLILLYIRNCLDARMSNDNNKCTNNISKRLPCQLIITNVQIIYQSSR